MAKKLFVPERFANARKEASMEIPDAVKKGFPKLEDNPNSKDPSKLEPSALERLPQPVGYRVLVIPYYMKSQTKEVCSYLMRHEIVKALRLSAVMS